MKALILVDIQNDFLPGGSLAVPKGDAVISAANRLQSKFDIVVATQDWHPADHGSFAENHAGAEIGDVIDLHGLEQFLWPVHCVQHTPGAELAAELDRTRINRIIQKGLDKTVDSYSGFFDNGPRTPDTISLGRRKTTELGEFLKECGVVNVYVCGLATDYCVKFTALDAVQLGFRTHLIEDASRGVNVKEGDVDRAIEDMKEAGISILQSDEAVQDLY